MKVEIYTGLGSQRRKIWDGQLDAIPREGEQVVLDGGDKGYRVEYVHHWLPSGKRGDRGWIELYVR